MSWEVLAVESGIELGLFLINRYIVRHSQTRPPTPQELQVPRTTEGVPRPLVYGQVRVDSPILVWHGNHTAAQIPNTTAFAYGLDMLFSLGIPAHTVNLAERINVKLIRLWFGERQFPLNGLGLDDGEETSGFVGDFSLMGGPGRGGGFLGIVEFHAGFEDQVLTSYPSTSPQNALDEAFLLTTSDVDRSLVPAYRNQLLAFVSAPSNVDAATQLIQPGIGESPHIPQIGFEVKAGTVPLGINAGDLPADANPANVIYDLITSPGWKLNIATAQVDTASFVAAAQTLFIEGHGYSRVLYDGDEATHIIASILTQIDGALFYNPNTGLITLKLIRADYDPATLPVITTDDTVEPPEFSVTDWRDTYNQVRVNFTDRAIDYGPGTVLAQRMANVIGQDNRPRSVTYEFPGVTTRVLAEKIAARELAIVSRPLAKATAVVNRKFYATLPGDVVKARWPKYNVNDLIFRVVDVDTGQLHDGKITLTLIEDAFDNTVGAFPSTTAVGFINVPDPVNHRLVTESPRWLQKQLYNAGLINSPDVQRIWTFANPDDDAALFSARSRLTGSYLSDVPTTGMSMRVKVASADYARELEPYDTTTGLVVDFGAAHAAFVAGLALLTPTHADIAGSGTFLFLIGDEILVCETVADLTGGLARLNNVWRGLLDTPAMSHAIGDEGWYVLGRYYVGHRGWPNVGGVSVQITPQLGYIVGSGGDPVDTINFRERCKLQLPAQNFGLAGESMTGGIQGQPALTIAGTVHSGYYKSVATFEEGIGWIAYRSRDKYSTDIRRGDENSEDITDPNVTWSLYAQKVGDAEVAVYAGLTDDGNSGVEVHATLGAAGHGAIDVILHTSETTPAGSKGVPPAHSTPSGWDSPRIRVNAPHWRNLLANTRFHDLLATVSSASSNWLVGGGSPQVQASTSSLTRAAAGTYVSGLATFGGCDFSETIDVSGYKPRGMNATCSFYFRNIVDADDTLAVDFYALSATNVVLATVSMAAIAGSTTLWQKVILAHAALPAGTAKLRVKATLECVGGGDTTAGSAIAEVAVHLGQFLDDVISDPTFDAGLGSWTSVTNSFVLDTGSPFANRDGTSSNYARGGAFAASEIRKDYTVPVGREFGTFVLRFARMSLDLSLLDTGNVVIEALSGAGAVLSSTSTGAEAMAVIAVWNRRRLVLALPDGTVTVRVRLVAVRTAAFGNSGACFADAHGQLHQDLDPANDVELDLSSPSVQPMPATWQTWHTTYPDLVDAGIPNPVVFAGRDPSSKGISTQPLRMRWSDLVVRNPSTLVGQFGGGIASVDSYRFTRQSGAGAIDYQAVDDGVVRFMNATSSFSFIVFFRVDEIGFSVACGLAGRCEATGWRLEIDATGHLVATLVGASATKTIARAGSTVIDGAIHMGAIVFDSVAQTLTVYDERGGTSVSTVGMGSISNVDSGVEFRLGRSRTTIDTLPGDIGRAYAFATTALTAGQVAAHWNYGQDPTGRLTVVRAVPVLVPGPLDANGDETIALLGAGQFAFGWHRKLAEFADDDVGEEMGLPLCRAHTNLIPSWDFAGASWTFDGGVTLTQSIQDPTGKLTGVRVTGSTPTAGFKVAGLTMTATATLQVVFWARCSSAAPLVYLELQNASGVVKQTLGIVLGTTWRRYTIGFTAWDGSTPTARLRFRHQAVTAITFDIGGLVWAAQGDEVPTLFATTALGSIATDVTAGDFNTTWPREMNAQGEVIAEGVALIASPGLATILDVSNGSDNTNAREIGCSASAQPTLDHRDATPTNVASAATAIDWREPWRLRGRWCSVGTLDVSATPFAGINVDGNVDSDVYGRTATWTYDATAGKQLRLGVGTSGNAAINCYLRRVVVRSREEKLP